MPLTRFAPRESLLHCQTCGAPYVGDTESGPPYRCPRCATRESARELETTTMLERKRRARR